MSSDQQKRKLAAVLCADAAGYSRFMERDEAGTARARKLIEESISLDPQYASAFMLMGATHIQDFLAGTGKSPKESLAQGIEWEQKALAMDDSLAEAHARLGHLYTFVHRHEEAITEADKAMAMELLRINPKFSAESFAKRLPQIHQRDKDRITDALKKAGL